MKQKMYSLDVNLYAQQRSLSHEKKVHIKMINHSMKNVNDKYLLKKCSRSCKKISITTSLV